MYRREKYRPAPPTSWHRGPLTPPDLLQLFWFPGRKDRTKTRLSPSCSLAAPRCGGGSSSGDRAASTPTLLLRAVAAQVPSSACCHPPHSLSPLRHPLTLRDESGPLTLPSASSKPPRVRASSQGPPAATAEWLQGCPQQDVFGSGHKDMSLGPHRQEGQCSGKHVEGRPYEVQLGRTPTAGAPVRRGRPGRTGRRRHAETPATGGCSGRRQTWE